MAFHFSKYTQQCDPTKKEEEEEEEGFAYMQEGCVPVWQSSTLQFSNWLAEFFIKLFLVYTGYTIQN